MKKWFSRLITRFLCQHLSIEIIHYYPNDVGVSVKWDDVIVSSSYATIPEQS